jgi:hypothetical protein
MGRAGGASSSSSMEAGVRYLGVYRLSDRASVASYCHALDSSLDEIESKVLQVLTANATQTHPRLSVSDRDVGTIHYETNRYAMFIAVTVSSYPQRTVFQCIKDMRTRFEGAFEEALHKAARGGLSKATLPLMSELCTRYADPTKVDKTLGVIEQVDDVKGIVGESIQHLLATHENLEVRTRRLSDAFPAWPVYPRSCPLPSSRPHSTRSPPLLAS